MRNQPAPQTNVQFEAACIEAATLMAERGMQFPRECAEAAWDGFYHSGYRLGDLNSDEYYDSPVEAGPELQNKFTAWWSMLTPEQKSAAASVAGESDYDVETDSDGDYVICHVYNMDNMALRVDPEIDFLLDSLFSRIGG